MMRIFNEEGNLIIYLFIYLFKLWLIGILVEPAGALAIGGLE
jgi:hypothetical protein